MENLCSRGNFSVVVRWRCWQSHLRNGSNVAAALDYSHRRITSGAGHDSCHLNTIMPAAVVFVPCKNGISCRDQSAGPNLQNALDVENAAAQVESIRAQLPTLQQQESQYINALSLLLDEPPGALKSKLRRPRLVPPAPPRVPLGIPSELARRRPGIRAAEAQLHAATADIGVAIGAFYPSVQLNGTVGFDALDVKNLWKGSSLQYSLGPSVRYRSSPVAG
jgi:hypothetical protein